MLKQSTRIRFLILKKNAYVLSFFFSINSRAETTYFLYVSEVIELFNLQTTIFSLSSKFRYLVYISEFCILFAHSFFNSLHFRNFKRFIILTRGKAVSLQLRRETVAGRPELCVARQNQTSVAVSHLSRLIPVFFFCKLFLRPRHAVVASSEIAARGRAAPRRFRWSEFDWKIPPPLKITPANHCAPEFWTPPLSRLRALPSRC